MNINANALKVAFYKHLYLDFKKFLDIKMGAKKYWQFGKEIIEPYNDIYSKTLNKYNVFEKIMSNECYFGKILESLKEDANICAAIEVFFNIIETNENALTYVSDLIQYNRNASSNYEGYWLQLEDDINKLILKYFWEKLCNEGGLTTEKSLSINVRGEEFSLSFNELCANPSKVTERNTIEFMGKLYEEIKKHCSNYSDPKVVAYFTRHLHASRIVRNNFAHKEKLLPENFADAVILARFKLYSFIAAIICLGKDKPQLVAHLILKDESETQNAQFNVWKTGSPETQVPMRKSSYGYEFDLERFNSYKIDISGTKVTAELTLEWFSLSPYGTWDGTKITLFNNDFEKVARDPSGTLSSILDMNTEIRDILANIDKTADQICKTAESILDEKLKDREEQKKQLELQLEEQQRQLYPLLEGLQQMTKDIVSSSQVQTELIRNLSYEISQSHQAQSEAFKQQNEQLAQITVQLEKQTKVLATIGTTIQDNKRSAQEKDAIVGELIELFKNQSKQISSLIEIVKKAQEGQHTKIKEENRKNAIKKLRTFKWKRRILTSLVYLLFIIATFSFCILITNLSFDNSITWLKNTICWVIWALIFIAISVVVCYCFYRLLSSIQKRTKYPKKLYIPVGITIISLIGAYLFIPYKSKKDFIEKYNFLTMNDTANRDAVVFMEECLADGISPDETLRSRLAEYYLLVHDYNQALRVTEPMRDVEKYRNGSFYAASALYHADEFVAVTDILKWHEKLKNSDLPLPYYRLKGILLAAGSKTADVYTQDIEKGIELLRYAADKGDAEAQYYLGFVLSHDITNWNAKDDQVLAPYDLYEAVYYLKKARQLPKASFELGNIFADLNMKDSARHYYLKAINSGVDTTVVLMASYRMGLLQEQWGIEKGDPDFMMRLKQKSYQPALLHDALLNNDMASAIARYIDISKKHGTSYNGYRYLSPLAFLYLANGEKEEALHTLMSAQPNEKFDMNFVNGLDSLLDFDINSDNYDTKIAPMRLSAENGSLYAEMICIYYDISRALIKGDSTLVNIDRFNEIGKKIPFAHILKCQLLFSAKHYDQALKYAEIALRQGHPVAALFIANCVKEGYNEHWESNFLNDVKGDMAYDTYRLNMLEKAIRIDPNKRMYLWFIRFVYDKKYNNQALLRTNLNDVDRKTQNMVDSGFVSKNKADSLGGILKDMLLKASAKEIMSEQDYLNRLNFWYEVIISNHDFSFECFILPRIREFYLRGYISDLSWYLKIMSSAIHDSREDSNEDNLNTITTLFNELDNKPFFEMSFQNSIRKQYENDKFRNELLSARSKYKKPINSVFKLVREGSIWKDNWTLSPLEIFYESIGKEKGIGKSLVPEKFQFVDKEDYSLFSKPL